MSLKISQWSGRLGNNILQLCHVIWLSLNYDYNIVSIPGHAMLNTANIVKQFSNRHERKNGSNPQIKVQTHTAPFYQWSDVWNLVKQKLPRPSITELKRIMDDYIYDILPKALKEEVVPDDVLVIHMRSGDTFRHGAAKNYKVPPSSFYKKIILDNKTTEKWKKVLIVTEPQQINPTIRDVHDWVNSTFDKSDLYCEIQSSTLTKDVATVLNSKSFVMSIGTFSLNLAILSRTIKNLYYSNGQFRNDELHQLSANGVNCVQYDVLNCSIFDKGWLYTPAQMKEIKTHSLNDIVKHIPTKDD